MRTLGDMASTLDFGILFGANMVKAICILVGVGLVLNAIIKGRARFLNYEETSWSSIIFLVLFGLALIAVGFVPQ